MMSSDNQIPDLPAGEGERIGKAAFELLQASQEGAGDIGEAGYALKLGGTLSPEGQKVAAVALPIAALLHFAASPASEA